VFRQSNEPETKTKNDAAMKYLNVLCICILTAKDTKFRRKGRKGFRQVLQEIENYFS
jgi:hypothetical protein